MKKIISLISAVAVAVACLTPVTFAATTPTMNVDVEQITDFTGDYSSYATVAGKGYDVYLLTFTGTGLNLELHDEIFDLSGTSIIGATVQFDVTADGDWKKAWSTKLHSSILTPSTEGVTSDVYTVAMATTATYLYPNSVATVSASDETPALAQVAFYLKQGNTATLTFHDCAINIGTFDDGAIDGTPTSYVDNTLATNKLAMSQSTLTLPLGSSTTAVTGVTMAPKALALKVGGTDTVTGTVAPNDATNKNVTYSSNNTSVATVNPTTGLVTAVAKGTATITVTTEDGSFTDTCAVTVSPADVEPAAADSKVVGNATTGLVDASGAGVTIDASRSYGAAKFTNVQIDDGEYVYKVVATGTNNKTSAVEEKVFDIAEGDLEVSGTASFIAIVRSATHTITSVILKAFAK